MFVVFPGMNAEEAFNPLPPQILGTKNKLPDLQINSMIFMSIFSPPPP